MADDKNLFNFGTGNIKKDQWIRDIDNEQDAFISRYTKATNKRKGLLLRLAFENLRARIANGDMMGRDDAGNFQFASSLNNEDKDVLEAQLRALGFMAGIARRQIQSTPSEPEKKKFSATTLEDEYKKSLFPGKFNETAYWDSDEDSRKKGLLDFLNNYLNNKDLILDSYLDFEDFGSRDKLRSKIEAAISAINNNNHIENALGQLGFQGSWINKPVEQEEESSKTEEEIVNLQIADFLKLLDIENKKRALAYAKDAIDFLGETLKLNGFSPYDFDHEYSNIIKGLPDDIAEINGLLFLNRTKQELSDYLDKLGANWRSIYSLGPATSKWLNYNLSRLFSKSKNGTYPFGDIITKYFTPVEGGRFLMNDTDEDNGRLVYYTPGEGFEVKPYNSPYRLIQQHKEGGILKLLFGGISAKDLNAYYKEPEQQKFEELKVENNQNNESNNSLLSSAENARIAATIADIASMGAAFVPGYGTAASAVLGLGSTATNFGADLADGQGLWNATKNAGFGLAADVMGIIPGLGGVGKGAKIARNLMWAVPKMMLWANTANGLYNIGEIKNSIVKLTSPSSMTLQDWLNVSQALQIMTGHGRSVATKIKKAGMSKTTTTKEPEYYIFTNKGKLKVSDETFKKLKEARGYKSRQDLTLLLMGNGVVLLQTRFAPWNTSNRFGAFNEVPGKTKVEILDKHKGWLSDENIVEKVENANPSVDIRGILNRINPYKGYYNKRNQPVMSEKNYSSFEARMNAEASPLDIRGPKQPYPTSTVTYKGTVYYDPNAKSAPKHKPLTDELKAARKLKADTKKKELALKKLEEMRRQQKFGLLEEMPIPSSLAAARAHELDIRNLSLRYANEVEIPTLRPETQGNKFYSKWGDAVRRRQAGGVLKALRNGGVIKALRGVLLNPDAGSWYDDVFSNYKDLIISQLDAEKANWLNGMLDRHYNLYKSAGNDFYTTPYINLNVKAYLDDYTSGGGFFNHLGDAGKFGFNDVGIAPGYNRLRYVMPGKRISGDNPKDDNPNKFTSDSLFSAITDDRRLLGRRTADYDDWTPENLAAFNEAIKPKGFKLEVGENGYYKLNPLTNEIIVKPRTTLTGTVKTDPVVQESQVNDKLSGIDTSFDAQYKNPLDPTPFITAGKTALGIYGNKNIFGNLLKEYPHPALQDPLHRQLAIVGDLRVIDDAKNKVGDMRLMLQQLRGADQERNFATSLETERVGRDVMDNAFNKDATRQFDTAQKLWNLKNEDTFTNWKRTYENAKAMENYKKAMAQIRAAWRSGDNNILMGAASDLGNWTMKNFLRLQDVIDQAKAFSLGDIEQYANNVLKDNPTYRQLLAKKLAGTLTDADRAKMLEILQEAIKGIRGKYSLLYYNLFGNGWFGGGLSEKVIAKDGTKLEVEKLKARGRDNDRYVSMIKDLRTTSRRRRRR